MHHARRPAVFFSLLAATFCLPGLHAQSPLGQWLTDADSQGGKIAWYVSGHGTYRELGIKNIGMTRVRIEGVYVDSQRVYWPTTSYRIDPAGGFASTPDQIHTTGFNAPSLLNVRIDWRSDLEDNGAKIIWSEQKQSPGDAECAYLTGEQIVGGRHKHWIRFVNAAWNRHPDGVLQVEVSGGQPERRLGTSDPLDRFKAQNFSYVDDRASGQWSWALRWFHRRSEGGWLVSGDWSPACFAE